MQKIRSRLASWAENGPFLFKILVIQNPPDPGRVLSGIHEILKNHQNFRVFRSVFRLWCSDRAKNWGAAREHINIAPLKFLARNINPRAQKPRKTVQI